MIKLENVDVFGWEAAIRGCRNPYNSWDKSDSHFGRKNTDTYVEIGGEKYYCLSENIYGIGKNDLKLMKSLSKAGSDHAKFLRMINVTVDITAPLYWWKEFDTYKVGTVANSTSTMHRLTHKPFEMSDFSCEHLTDGSINLLKNIIEELNKWRRLYNRYDTLSEDNRGFTNGDITCKKDIWWQMIQLLPSSYNQKRTVQLNYQVLKSMYFARKNHKLDEWREFCKWCESLPYFCDICINND